MAAIAEATAPLQFTSRRSPVLCMHGVCCTSQPLASEAGLSILKAGGNAADAAVAAVAALNVTEACMCGLGGDAFCLYYDAATKTVKGLNGSGRAPQALTPERARAVAGAGANRLPADSVHCVTVPGAAHCWTDCVKDFGRLPLADVLAPAIALAEEGVPIHAVAAQLWSDNAHQLLDRWGGLVKNPGAASLLIDGRPPRHGEVLRNPELAATLRTLASEGADGFYKGAVAEAIVQCVRAKGGVLSVEDLAAHKTERVSPISTTFRGKVVHELPPNGSGLVALMALTTLEQLPPSSGRPEDVLCQVEALRMAFAKGLADIGDGAPATADAHLSEAHNVAAALENLGTDTTYLCCVDAAGNACSFICSNFEAFGSGLVPEGCGFSLQNRGRNFVLQEGHPNCIGPGKRPYHTIIPGMVTDGGGLRGNQIYGAFVLNRRVDLHAIDATPARWRGDAGSSPLDRARTAASSPRNDLVKNCRVHPSHWLISTQVEVSSTRRLGSWEASCSRKATSRCSAIFWTAGWTRRRPSTRRASASRPPRATSRTSGRTCCRRIAAPLSCTSRRASRATPSISSSWRATASCGTYQDTPGRCSAADSASSPQIASAGPAATAAATAAPRATDVALLRARSPG